MPHRSRGEVDLAGTEDDACLVIRLADPEVERAAHDAAELLLFEVMMEDRSRGASRDAPEDQLQQVTVDHTTAKPWSFRVVELVDLVEVAVLVRQVHRPSHNNRS